MSLFWSDWDSFVSVVGENTPDSIAIRLLHIVIAANIY